MIAIDENRRCYSCTTPLGYYQYYLTYHLQDLVKVFNDDMLDEIWKNEIFVIECCTCHKIRKETLRVKKLLEEMIKNE